MLMNIRNTFKSDSGQIVVNSYYDDIYSLQTETTGYVNLL